MSGRGTGKFPPPVIGVSARVEDVRCSQTHALALAVSIKRLIGVRPKAFGLYVFPPW